MLAGLLVCVALGLIIASRMSAGGEEPQRRPVGFAPAARPREVEPVAAMGFRDPYAIRVSLRAPTATSVPAVEPVAVAPVKDPSLLAERRVVSYYGNPWSAQMGILGELTKAELVRELKEVAKSYEVAGGKAVQPAIHLIASVAQAAPGADGLYLYHMPDEVIEEYATLAAENDLLLILDLQVGRSSVQDEIASFYRYLLRPYVHLALDPEFTMPPGKQPGVSIGTMDAEQINYAIRALAELVEGRSLPNKILIIHQFNAEMVRNRTEIRQHPRVDFVIDMDGYGGRESKLGNYQLYAADGASRFAGIKLFYRHDFQLLRPEELMDLIPPPDLVIYQ
jgi:hypothetical protein